MRDDRVDQVFLTMNEKFMAIIEDNLDCQKRGQPVLVGTSSIEVSEHLSGWWSHHSTANPLGIQPQCEILYGDKFAEINI